MDIREKIVANYPLTDKVNCDLDCYLLDKKRYLIFWDEMIAKNSINQILTQIDAKTKSNEFSQWKTLIVVGKTTDAFKKEELFYFDNVSTFVVFYLVDETKNKIYMNDSWIFTLGLNYGKFVRKINKILTE